MAGDVQSPQNPPRQCFSFSISDYRKMLNDFRELGYRSVRLQQIDPVRKHLFLRHDVDMCLERAVAIAEVEAEEGFTGTYYVLVSTNAYNAAAAWSREMLRRLISLGHAIGLHFDATAYSDVGGGFEDFAKREGEILRELAGASVDSISFHRPVPELLGLTGKFAGLPHTYEPRFTTEIGYVSDSSGGFFHGHPLDHPAVRGGRAIQVLTHPIWWHAETRRSAGELIDNLREERHATLDRILSAATAKAQSRGGPLPT